MATYTRFGSPVEIRYRCDDYNPATGEGSVHAFFLDDEHEHDAIVLPIYELRDDSGLAAILDTAAGAPIAHCLLPDGCHKQADGSHVH